MPSRRFTDWDGGCSWIASPEADAQRASHALATETGVWVIDPVDTEGLDDKLSEYGAVAGVVVLQDRHTRDAETVADRHDVPVSVPEWMDLTREKLDTELAAIGSELSETSYTIHELRRSDEWEEAVLWNDQTDTLVVPETLGTLPAFTTDEAAVGLHPAVEDPPEMLAEWEPDRLLVGHGLSIRENASAELAALR